MSYERIENGTKKGFDFRSRNTEETPENSEPAAESAAPATEHVADNNTEQVAKAAAPSDPQAETAPAKPVTAPTSPRGGRRKPGRPKKEAVAPSPAEKKASSTKQHSFWLLPTESRELKVSCAITETTVNEFACGAVLDSLHYTYECKNQECGFQFTARTSEVGQEPPKAESCPFCGWKKVSLVKYS